MDICSTKKTLIFFFSSPFTKQYYDRFEIDYLSDFFEVKIFDCTPWIAPKIWEISYHTRFHCKCVVPIHSHRDIQTKLPKNLQQYAVCFLDESTKSIFLKKMLRQFGYLLIEYTCGLLPGASTEYYGFIQTKIRKLRTFLGWKNIFLFILAYIKRPIIPDIVLLGGEMAMGKKWVQQSAIKIAGHSFDYDTYRRVSKKSHGLKRGNYIVFLDEDMVHHQDYLILGLKSPVTEKIYYYLLNRYFDYLERRLGVPVIFAAHPKSNYHLYMHCLYGRRFFLGQTAELVSNARLVLLHDSTSISFAVLWKKPMIFLTSNELNITQYGDFVKNMACLVKRPIVNLNCQNSYEITDDNLFCIDELAYQSYCDNFIKVKNSPDKTVAKILHDFLNSA